MDYSQMTLDILQNPQYAGAIESIQWVRVWMDSGFGMVVTLVAYLIAIVAMLKNILAAAYCAYPVFWDKVDQAHKEVENVAWVQQIRDTFRVQEMNNGSFSSVMLRILPNIKSCTDFDGPIQSPKVYWTRALPLMFLCICIAGFIYNGFYRDAAGKVVDFGSEITSRILLEVDPIAVFDQFTGATGRPVFASDGSELPEQKLINKVATNVYNAVIGEYNDISGAESKRALANEIEGKVASWIQDTLAKENPDYTNGVSWRAVVQVSITNGEVDISQINGKSNADGTVMQYARQFPISDLSISSNKNVGLPMYVRMRINFEKQAVKSGKAAVTDIVLHLPKGEGDVKIPTDKNLHIKGANEISFADNPNNVVRYDAPSETLSIKWANGVKHTSTIELDTPLFLVDNRNGLTHKIVKIQRDGAGQMFSSPSEGRSFGLDDTEVGISKSKSAEETE